VAAQRAALTGDEDDARNATLLFGLGAAGALPGAAQDVATQMLGQVGVSTSSPSSSSGGHAESRGHSSDAPDTTATSVGPHSDSTKGSDIASIATDSSTTGLEKGAAVSSTASNGKSHAGLEGAPDTGAAPVSTPPVSTPPVSTPVSGPPVSTPGVSVPPVSTPPVSTPPVSIPSH
jgi:hypothetical protein